MRRALWGSVLSGLLLLNGCAAFGVVASSDPLTKLGQAENLFMKQDRPLPAEKLIREAIETYQERDDPHGLGTAHVYYGDLLTSRAVANWEIIYRRDGFQDKSVTFDNRLAKASEHYSQALDYFERAAQQHRDAGRYDALTNVYFSMGWSNYMLNQREKACGFYEQTLEAYAENIRRNPTAKPYSPSGSVPDFVAREKRRAGCP
jgi:tetratricopeptide (TPR) repeat protein